MHRNQQILRRPSSSGLNQSSSIHYLTQPHGQPFLRVSPSGQLRPHIDTLPLNQTSAVSYSAMASRTVRMHGSPTKPSSLLVSPPRTQKVFFTYLRPGSLQVQRHFIETIVQAPGRDQGGEWEQRYFELVRQITSFEQIHQKMTEEFLLMKEEIRHNSQMSRINQMSQISQTSPATDKQAPEAQEPTPSNTLRIESQIKESSQLEQKCLNLLVQLGELRQESSAFKDQNIKLQNVIVQYQNDIMEQGRIQMGLEAEKGRLLDIIRDYELRARQIDLSSTQEMKKIQEENYQTKLLLAAKNKQIEELAKTASKKAQARNPQRKTNVEKQFEERLLKVKAEYERKEKKYEKLIEQKVKQVSQLRTVIVEVEEKERMTRELKQKYEKLYAEKKQQAISLRNIQEVSHLEGESKHQQYYEDKIKELTKIAKEQVDKIKKMEEERRKLEAKILQYEDNYVSQKQLEKLHHVIEQQKNQVLSVGGYTYDELNNKAEPYFNGKIFEEQLIYELKKDNEKLLKYLRKTSPTQELGSLHFKYIQSLEAPNSSIKLGLLMKSTISDTFFKLCRITDALGDSLSSRRQSFTSSHQSPSNSPSKTRRSRESPKKYKKTQQSDESAMLSRTLDNLKTLKVYFTDLNEMCERVMQQMEREGENFKLASKQQTEIIRTEREFNVLVPRETQLIEFHKSENKKLEVRIDELIQINNSLKEKLTAQHAEGKSGVDYWQLEASRLKVEVEEITARYNKILGRFEQSQDKKEQFESKCALYSVEIERLNLLLRDNEQRVAKLTEQRNKNEQIKHTHNSLERQLQLERHSSSQLAITIEQLTRTISTKQQQLDSVNQTLLQTTNQCQSLRVSNHAMASRLQQQTSNYLLLQQSVSNFQHRLEACSRSLESYEAQIGSNKAAMESQLSKYASLETEYSLLRTQSRTQGTAVDQFVLEALRSAIIEVEVLLGELAMVQSPRNADVLGVVRSKFAYLLNTLSTISATSRGQSSEGMCSAAQKLKLQQLIRQLITRSQNNAYPLELVRSVLVEIECLVSEIPVEAGRSEGIQRAVVGQVGRGLECLGGVDILDDY